MEYTKILKKGSKGNDVKYMQFRLIALGYSCGNTKDDGNFGSNTEIAVKNYQKEHKDTYGKNLTVDGIIGEKTWAAIERDYENGKKATDIQSDTNKDNDKDDKEEKIDENSSIFISLDDYNHITSDKRKKIEDDLKKVSSLRQEIVREILKYAYDKDIKGDVRALYLFGANLYDSNLKINYADEEEIDKLAKANPSYFNNGRKEWMKEQVKKNSKLPASDCSGMEVGWGRKYKLVSNTFDTTANNLCSDKYSKEISKSELKPGDWVGKSGHIGTYVGGGYVVEFVGGAYGAQITTVDKRVCYDFIKKKNATLSNWTKFRKCLWFKD